MQQNERSPKKEEEESHSPIEPKIDVLSVLCL
jgi:hypothetical protein